MTTTLICLIIAMLPMWAIGMVIFIAVAKGMTEPADTSNRIGHIRAIWFATTRTEELVSVWPWLAKDEKDIVEGK